MRPAWSRSSSGVTVVLDGYWWDRGPHALTNHVRGLSTAWAQTFPEDQVTVVARRLKRGESQTPPAPENLEVLRLGVWPHPLSNATILPLVARRRSADVVMAQNFTSPVGRQRAVFIHDLMFETNPEWFTPVERAYFSWMTRSARIATHIFTSTATECRRIGELVPGSRPLPAGQGLSVLESRDMEPVLGLSAESFYLTVGRLNARKNLETVLEGARLSGTISPHSPLVVVGQPDGRSAVLPEWTASAIDGGSVIFLENASDAQLRWLMTHARAFLFLSRDEGLGLPPLEARVLGARVIVSDIPVFRETMGAHALFVDPNSADDVARLLREVAKGEAPLVDTAQSDIVGRYNWPRTARFIRSHLTDGL